MIHELVYTSAPRGLKPGVQGFCTVESTPDMAQAIGDRLESLSGYRHLFAAHDAQARLNPVSYSHLKVKIGSTLYHVLSRVCDAGLDYSQRSNKLAHHVLLDTSALGAPGPAWLLAQPDVMRTAWAGEPRLLPANRRLPDGQPAPRVCEAWKQITGDAGWAGVLAETALDGPGRQAAIIFKPGMDTLPLVVEALGLLPPDRRWAVTFSTFFNKLPPGIDCQWRFLVDGEAETVAALKNPQTLVINLCHPPAAAEGGELVTAARTGKLVHREPTRQTAPKLSSARRAGVDTASKSAAPSGPAPNRPSLSSSRGLRAPERKRSKAGLAIGGVALLGLMGVIAYFAGASASPVAPPPISAEEEDALPVNVPAPMIADAKPAPTKHARRKPEHETTAEEAPVAVTLATSQMPEKTVKPLAPPPDPLGDLKKLAQSPGYLELPKPAYLQLTQLGSATAVARELVRLYLSPALQEEMTLELESPVAKAIKLEPLLATVKAREWQVVRTSALSLVSEKLGKFSLEPDGLLTFQWNANLKPEMKPQFLQYSLLKVTVGGQNVKLPLRKPATSADLPVWLATGTSDLLPEPLDLSPFRSPDATIEVELLVEAKNSILSKALGSAETIGVPLSKKATVVPIPLSGQGMPDLQLEISIGADNHVSVAKRMVLTGGRPQTLSLKEVRGRIAIAKIEELSSKRKLDDLASENRAGAQGNDELEKLKSRMASAIALQGAFEALRGLLEQEQARPLLVLRFHPLRSDEP